MSLIAGGAHDAWSPPQVRVGSRDPGQATSLRTSFLSWSDRDVSVSSTTMASVRRTSRTPCTCSSHGSAARPESTFRSPVWSVLRLGLQADCGSPYNCPVASREPVARAKGLALGVERARIDAASEAQLGRATALSRVTMTPRRAAAGRVHRGSLPTRQTCDWPMAMGAGQAHPESASSGTSKGGYSRGRADDGRSARRPVEAVRGGAAPCCAIGSQRATRPSRA